MLDSIYATSATNMSTTDRFFTTMTAINQNLVPFKGMQTECIGCLINT